MDRLTALAVAKAWEADDSWGKPIPHHDANQHVHEAV